jgi:phosphoglucosamine mutase
MRRKERPLSDLVAGMERFPQVLVNVPVATKRPIEDLAKFQQRLRQVEQDLGDRGRVLIRYSGTESKARVMVEGDDETRVTEYAESLADDLRRALAQEG